MRLGLRLLSLVLVLVVSSSAGYLLLRAAPGDPIDVLLAGARDPRPERKAELRRQFALDRPAIVGAAIWMSGVVRGDLGRSFVDGRPVAQRIGERLATTLGLAALAIALAAGLGLLLGAAAVRRPAGAGLVISIGYALPVAGLGVAALACGAPYGALAAIVPAAICLALPLAASTARQIERALAATLTAPFIVTLRARGLDEGAITRRALRASLGPAVALLFGQFPALLSGALVVEILFGVPGLGKLASEALYARDYPTVLGLLVVSSVTALVASWLGDVLRRALDPRLESAS